MDWIGPDLDSIWSGPDISWIGPDLKLAPCGPDDADGDVRGGGDEDGDDDDEDRITARISIMMAMAPSSDWIWLRSVLIRIIKWKFAWHRARLDLDSLESDMDALVRMRVFPTKKLLIESWQPRLQPCHMHRRTIPWAQQNVFIEVGRTGWYWSVARRLPERLGPKAPIIPPRSGA